MKKIVAFIPLWACAVLWHLWRIGTLRPAFRNLGDTAFTAVSFSGLFFAAALLRWSALGAYPVLEVTVSTLIYGVGLTCLVERPGRSSALTFVFLGASVVVDLAACALHIAGLLPTTSLPSLVGPVVEVALMIAAYRQFRAEPVSVQAAGYRPGRRAPITKN